MPALLAWLVFSPTSPLGALNLAMLCTVYRMPSLITYVKIVSSLRAVGWCVYPALTEDFKASMFGGESSSD